MGCAKLKERLLKDLAREALIEDIGKGDITTQLTVPKNNRCRAKIIANRGGVICGLELAKEVFKHCDRAIEFTPKVSDGDLVGSNTVIAMICGKTSCILTAERVALNFLTFLSGIATKTRKYVTSIKRYKARIVDTRKTIPGLRLLQKYAVRVGGGLNHRMRLDELVLVKDNHLAVLNAGDEALSGRIGKIKNKVLGGLLLEVEAKNLSEFQQALKVKPDIIMLDNMTIAQMKKAVRIKRNSHYALRNIIIEASGGITLKNIRKVAACGVDWISIGDLTHSVQALDMSLELI